MNWRTNRRCLCLTWLFSLFCCFITLIVCFYFTGFFCELITLIHNNYNLSYFALEKNLMHFLKKIYFYEQSDLKTGGTEQEQNMIKVTYKNNYADSSSKSFRSRWICFLCQIADLNLNLTFFISGPNPRVSWTPRMSMNGFQRVRGGQIKINIFIHYKALPLSQ